MTIDGRSYVRNGAHWPWHVEIISRPEYSTTACGMRLAPSPATEMERSIDPRDRQCERCMDVLAGLSGAPS